MRKSTVKTTTIDKDEAVTLLQERGFNVKNDDGVVIALLEKKQDVKRFQKSMKEIGYTASSGYSFVRNDHEESRETETGIHDRDK